MADTDNFDDPNYGTVEGFAEQLLRWSWADEDKHPKDRLTDHQALDIAVRVRELELKTAGLKIEAERAQAQLYQAELLDRGLQLIFRELAGLNARLGDRG